MSTVFRISDIVEDPSLDTRLLGGAGGLDRVVLWAHSCEMEEPGRWLGPDELLMTIGLCVPKGSAAQRDFIAKLDDAGLAGITIGDDGLAPRLTKAMLAEAESRNFPVLATGVNTPFAAMGRTVAAANTDQQAMSVLFLAKLYQVAGRRDAAERRSGAQLSELYGAPLTVVDDETGCVVIGKGVRAEPDTAAYPLRMQRPCHLLVASHTLPDTFSMLHLSQVVAVDAEAILREAVQNTHEASFALGNALRNSHEGRAALVRRWGEQPAAYRVITSEISVPGQIPLALALSGSSAAAIEADGRVVIAARAGELDDIKSLMHELEVHAAMSAEHRNLADLGGAVAEATSELTAAIARKERWREFRGQRVSLLSRSRSESEEIVSTVLGHLSSDDEKHTPLRETLFAFLDNDLRWSVTAANLGLHRQTLVYRLGQVEKLTGRSVKRTQDVAEFWLAKDAWAQLDTQ